jgi:hypothetical protein
MEAALNQDPATRRFLRRGTAGEFERDLSRRRMKWVA